MCRILTLWDTKFRFCEGKVWRFYKHYKRWMRCDDNSPNGKGYIQLCLTNKNGKRRMFYLNRIVYKAYKPSWNIMDTSMNNFIDHKDGNKLNNHIDNLRVLSNQKNCFNTKAKGYFYNKQRKKWVAQIVLNKKVINLGYYDTKEEAHDVYMKIKPYLHNIENKKFDKMNIEDLDFISNKKIKNKLLFLINVD